jgi:cytoskeletal protein CcmA (bactofilin family)
MEGKMKVAAGLVRINAHFKGEISSQGALVVHDQGEVEGDILCKVVSVTGKVKGTIHAAERLEIKEHGIVLGDIYTPCLLVDPGGFFDGQCNMPAKEPTSRAPSDADAKPQP